MPKRILYLSDMGLRAYQVDKQKLIEVQQFCRDKETDFIDYLRRDLRTPIYWLIDTTQEEYQLTTIPHVMGKNRRDLLKNRARRFFEHTDYTYSVIQGREKRGRNDDQVLFTALSNPALLQPWLTLIHSHKIPLAGIYSVPLLSQGLLSYFPKNTYTLLVTPTPQISPHNPLGLRQSFFINQQLQLSRLIPFTFSSEASHDSARYLFEQIIKMQFYLDNARKLPHSDALSVIILSHPDLLSSLRDYQRKNNPANTGIQILDIHEVASQLGLTASNEATFYLHSLVAYQLERNSANNHYAKTLDTRYFIYRNLQAGMFVLSGVLVTIAAMFSGENVYQAWQIEAETEQDVQKIIRLRRTIEELDKTITIPPIKTDYVQDIIAIGKHLNAYHLLPHKTWIMVSAVLSSQPDYHILSIEQLEWGVGSSHTDLFDNKVTSPMSDSKESNSNTTNTFFEGVRLSGKIRLPTASDSYIPQLNVYNAFLGDLKYVYGNSNVTDPESPLNKQTVIKENNKTDVIPFKIEIFIKHLIN